MKILWFCNSPCGSVRRGNAKIIAGGWLISLEDEVKRCSGISLNVAYFSDIKEVSFDFEGVKYYPMFIGSNAIGFQRVLKRYKSIEGIDKKKIPLMLDVVEDCKPDLIHIHGTEESFGLIAQYIKDIPIGIIAGKFLQNFQTVLVHVSLLHDKKDKCVSPVWGKIIKVQFILS